MPKTPSGGLLLLERKLKELRLNTKRLLLPGVNTILLLSVSNNDRDLKSELLSRHLFELTL